MIRARSTRLVGSVRDREISCKRCRCSASVGSAITRRGATTGSPNPIPPPRLLPHLAQHAKSNPNILIFWNLYTSLSKNHGAKNGRRQLLRSVKGRFLARHGVQESAPGARAGE